MKIFFLSYLTENDKFGGSPLRNKAVREILTSLGFSLEVYHRKEGQAKSTFSTYLNGLKYGLNTRILFNKGELTVPEVDFIHFDNLQFFSWDFLPKCPPIIFNAHDMQLENYFGKDLNSRARKFAKYELKCMKKSHVIFVCSQREKDLICQLDSSLFKKVFVLPNLLDSNDYQLSGKFEKDTVSFIGSLNYFPNQQAVDYLCEEFLPAIPSEIKNKYRFVIAGRTPQEGQREKAEKAGFVFLENLSEEELAELLERTKVSLIPLMHGSGTRLKIIEAIFSGATVLSTPIGREGIDSGLVYEAEIENYAKKFIELTSIDTSPNPQEIQKFYESFDTKRWADKNAKQLSRVLQEGQF